MSGSSAAVTSPSPMSSASARATSAATTSAGGGANVVAHARGGENPRTWPGRDAFLGQQHRDAVVDAIGELAVARHQRLAQCLALRRTVDALDAAGGDRLRSARARPRAIEHRQRLARGGAGEDVEQFAIHRRAPLRCRERVAPLEYAPGRIRLCDRGRPWPATCRHPRHARPAGRPRDGIPLGLGNDAARGGDADRSASRTKCAWSPRIARRISCSNTPQQRESRGLRAIIAGAGGAAHLPGMLAAKTAPAGARRAGAVASAQRHRFAAVDRADAGRHSGRDARDRHAPARSTPACSPRRCWPRDAIRALATRARRRSAHAQTRRRARNDDPRTDERAMRT